MKYKDVDWSSWPEPPSETVYNDWVKARKSKKHPVITQSAINKYAMHIKKLVDDDVCSVETAVSYAAEAGWRAIMYKFVIGAINRNMDNYSGQPAVYADQTNLVSDQQNRSTRDLNLEEELEDTSWSK